MNLWVGLGACVLAAVVIEVVWCVATVLDTWEAKS